MPMSSLGLFHQLQFLLLHVESALSDALFDPMDALLQDAVADSELVPDFIDRLLDSQPLAGASIALFA